MQFPFKGFDSVWVALNGGKVTELTVKMPPVRLLLIDPNDASKGYWVDLTYAHGAPIKAGASLNANIEAARGSAQVFYQFDDLFHDNDIFSPHPTFETP
ncbi:hypothetical protein BH20VER3_BH20VER3_19190 [soil metagenome]